MDHQAGAIGLFKRIGYSPKPIMVVIRSYFLILAAVVGIHNFHLSLQSLLAPHVFKKDFVQEYLMVKAVLSGLNPYLPLPNLASRFIGPLPGLVFMHPTPHPPPVTLLCLPMGWLSYNQAAIVWFLFELSCISLSVILLLRWSGVRSGVALASVSAMLILVWGPFTEELLLGQLNALLLVLLIGAWLSLRSEKDFRGGLLVGGAIAIKLIAWPILVFLAVRRKWRAACAATMLPVTANLAASLLMGFDRVVRYYLDIGMAVSRLYHANEFNFSLWTIGWRVFEGTGSPI